MLRLQDDPQNLTLESILQIGRLGASPCDLDFRIWLVFKLFYSLYKCFVCVHVYVPYECLLESLELVLQMAETHVGSGN